MTAPPVWASLVSVAITDEWAGGYLVSRPTPRASFSDAELVPETVWSASECLCPALDAWALAWVQADDDERRTKAAALGLVGPLDALVAWATAAFDAERLGWPNVFFDVHDALEARERFFPEAAVYGLGLNPSDAAPFLDVETPPGCGALGVPLALARRVPLASAVAGYGSETLGYDVLGWNPFAGGFHSYLCDSLEPVLAAQLGLRPDAWGLFSDASAARRAAALCELDSTGAEPGPWRAWRVVRYG